MCKRCKKFIPQTHCRQCRADACGTLGEDKDMELETLHATIANELSNGIHAGHELPSYDHCSENRTILFDNFVARTTLM